MAATRDILTDGARPGKLGKLSDSPWFWICTFASVAVLALFLIEPKYRRREAGLEGKYQMRLHLNRPAEDGAEFRASEDLEKTPRPLVWILGSTVAVAWSALFWTRHLKPAETRHPERNAAGDDVT
jgi:hypothetical protein